jgi:hypothetical protein
MPRLRPPPAQNKTELDARERAAWDFVNRCAVQAGCAIATRPYTSPLHLTCASTNTLPAYLENESFGVRVIGKDHRLMPVVVTEKRGFKEFKQTVMELSPVTIYEITL